MSAHTPTPRVGRTNYLRRSFSYNERVAALLFFYAEGGSVRGTARKLGIPETTLRRWARGERCPRLRFEVPQQKAQLTDVLERAVWRVLGLIEGKTACASLVQLATSLGIAVDAMCRLGGPPRSTVGLNAFDLGGLSVEGWNQLGALLRAAHARGEGSPK